MKESLKELTIEQAEMLLTLLENNPQINDYDQKIELSDLIVDKHDHIVYATSWTDASYSDAETGHNTVQESVGQVYKLFISLKELNEKIKNNI